MPVFWLGEVVNMLSQNRLHGTFLFSWVPPLGYVPLTQSPVGWFKSLLLPWLTLSVLYIGLYARVLRSSLVEVVFNLHGLGWLTYQSLVNFDLPVIMATVIYAAFFVVIVNAAVDLLYAALDPRVRHA